MNTEILFIPGWASDTRVLDLADSPLTSPYGKCQRPADMIAHYTEMLGSSEKKLDIVGWSMGALIASLVAQQMPEKIGRLIFVSAKGRYSPQEIEIAKDGVNKNLKAYLYNFYGRCFSQGTEALHTFKRTLFKEYCDIFDSGTLLEGLDLLARGVEGTQELDVIDKTFVYGMNDPVVSVKDAQDFIAGHGGEKRIVMMDNAGHAPFLSKKFLDILAS